MNKRKFTVEQKHIDLAFDSNLDMCHSCVIFQVLKDAGVDVESVTHCEYWDSNINAYRLDKVGESISQLQSYKWQGTLGLTFEAEVP